MRPALEGKPTPNTLVKSMGEKDNLEDEHAEARVREGRLEATIERGKIKGEFSRVMGGRRNGRSKGGEFVKSIRATDSSTPRNYMNYIGEVVRNDIGEVVQGDRSTLNMDVAMPGYLTGVNPLAWEEEHGTDDEDREYEYGRTRSEGAKTYDTRSPLVARNVRSSRRRRDKSVGKKSPLPRRGRSGRYRHSGSHENLSFSCGSGSGDSGRSGGGDNQDGLGDGGRMEVDMLRDTKVTQGNTHRGRSGRRRRKRRDKTTMNTSGVEKGSPPDPRLVGEHSNPLDFKSLHELKDVVAGEVKEKAFLASEIHRLRSALAARGEEGRRLKEAEVIMGRMGAQMRAFLKGVERTAARGRGRERRARCFTTWRYNVVRRKRGREVLGRVMKGCVIGPVRGSRVGKERCREYLGRWRDKAREWGERIKDVQGKVRIRAAVAGREMRREKEREAERRDREVERRKWREEVERVKTGMEARERELENRLEEVSSE